MRSVWARACVGRTRGVEIERCTDAAAAVRLSGGNACALVTTSYTRASLLSTQTHKTRARRISIDANDTRLVFGHRSLGAGRFMCCAAASGRHEITRNAPEGQTRSRVPGLMSTARSLNRN